MSAYRLHPAVPAELEAAAEWYEQRSLGLGEEFLGAAEDAIALLVETGGDPCAVPALALGAPRHWGPSLPPAPRRTGPGRCSRR